MEIGNFEGFFCFQIIFNYCLSLLIDIGTKMVFIEFKGYSYLLKGND